MNATQAANRVRQIIRKTGTDPKGMCRVINTDYTTEVEVNLRHIPLEKRDEVEETINNLDCSGNFTWNVY